MGSIQESGAIPHCFAEKLMGGIEKEGHDSRLLIHFGVPVAAFTFLLHPVSAGIPILMGEPKEAPLRVQESEIHSPSINSKRLNPLAISRDRQFETMKDFPVKAHDIPNQPAGQIGPGILEPMDFFEV